MRTPLIRLTSFHLRRSVRLLYLLALGLSASCGGGGGGGGGTITTGGTTGGGGAAGFGSVTGRAVNSTSLAALSNFTATTDTGETVTVTNSATGVFTIVNVTAGSRTITVTAQNFTTTTTAARTVTANQTTDYGTIALVPSGGTPPVTPPIGGGVGTVTGTVVDAANITIRIANFVARTDTGETVTVTASATGTFTIPNVTPGSRTVTITAPGFNVFTTAVQTVTANATTNYGTIAISSSGGQGGPPPAPPPTFSRTLRP